MSLNQNDDHSSVLVHGSPQIMELAPDLHEDLVQMPHVTKSTLSTLELPSVLGSKLPTPLPDRLVGDEDASLREEFLDISVAQGEPVVQPDAMADDLRREPIAAIPVCGVGAWL